MMELCWWQTVDNEGIYDFVLEVDEKDLQKLELALLNDPDSHNLEQGFFKLKLLNSVNK